WGGRLAGAPPALGVLLVAHPAVRGGTHQGQDPGGARDRGADAGGGPGAPGDRRGARAGGGGGRSALSAVAGPQYLQPSSASRSARTAYTRGAGLDWRLNSCMALWACDVQPSRYTSSRRAGGR